MAEIKVHLVEPTPEGRLYYFRDPQIDTHILYISAKTKSFWGKQAYSVNVYATVFFGLLVDRRLYAVEIFHNYKFWKVDESVKIPDKSIPADIIFPWVKERGFSIEEDENRGEYRIDPGRNVILISFGMKIENPTYVALSEQCFAILNDDNMVGLIIKLADAPLKVYSTHHGISKSSI